MKLVEILARELDSWPEGVTVAVQDNYGSNKNHIWFCIGESQGISRIEDEDEDGWIIGCGVRICDYLVSSFLASDHATAIVTREMWQAERERLKVGQAVDCMTKESDKRKSKKASADGWIRHRGGKCPVGAGVMADVRNRAGDISTGRVDCTSVSWHWSHDKHPGDIMAYKIHKPAEETADEKVMRECVEKCADTEPGESITINMRDPHPENPLAWRDRIREIDRTVEALEEERVSLIQRLEGEGFRLIGEQPVDMSDCLKWKRGDKVMANDDSAGGGGGFHKGGIYVMREDCTNKDHIIKVVADDNGVENGWGSKFFTFHSRPSA